MENHSEKNCDFAWSDMILDGLSFSENWQFRKAELIIPSGGVWHKTMEFDNDDRIKDLDLEGHQSHEVYLDFTVDGSVIHIPVVLK